MYKLKTNRAAKKRYRVTGSGHVKAGRKGKRHCLGHKSRKRKRHLHGTLLLGPTDKHLAAALLPYETVS